MRKRHSLSSPKENMEKGEKTLTELRRRKGQSPWTRAWSSAPVPRWTCKHSPRPSGRFPGRSERTVPRYGSWEKRDCRGTLRGKWFSWKQKRFPPPPEFVPVNGKVAESTLAFDPTFRNPNLCEPSWKLQFLSFLSQYTFDDDSLPQSLWTELEKIAIFIAIHIWWWQFLNHCVEMIKTFRNPNLCEPSWRKLQFLSQFDDDSFSMTVLKWLKAYCLGWIGSGLKISRKWYLTCNGSNYIKCFLKIFLYVVFCNNHENHWLCDWLIIAMTNGYSCLS